MAIGNDKLPDVDVAYAAGYKAGALRALECANDYPRYRMTLAELIAHVEATGTLEGVKDGD